MATAETKSTTITDEIPQIPQQRQPPPMRAVAAETPAISASAVREYVAGTGYSSLLGNFYRTLGRSSDDVEEVIGLDTYERMVRDPQVFSCLSILKMAAISQEVQIQPAAKEEDPRYAEAEEYADFCRRCVARIPGFRTSFLFEMLDALAFGHRLAEQTFEVAGGGEDRGKLVWKTLKVKPRTSYAFITDAYGSWVGLLGVVPGLYWQGTSGTFTYSAEALAEQANVLPPDKFALLTFHPKAGDPRGTAWLRPAYDAWFLKTQLYPEYWRYLMQFASPSVIGTVGPDQVRTPLLDENNDPVLDTNGNVVYLDPLHDLLTALLAYKNGGAIALPHGSDVKSLFTYNTGEAFRFAVDLLNHEINKGILFQSLATMEAQFGSRSASQTHQDILEIAIQYVRTTLENMVAQMLSFLLRINFGDDAVALTPKVNLGDTEQQDFAAKAGAVARLDTAGFWDASQYPQLDTMLGAPRRTQEEADARAAMRLAAASTIEAGQAAADPAKPPDLANQIITPKQQRAEVAA